MSIAVPGLYAGAFLGSLVLSWGLTPLARRAAQRFDILDHPAANKSHTTPTPYLGGLAIVLAFCVAILVASALVASAFGAANAAVAQLGVVLGLGAALSLTGLFDDLRGGLNPWLRLGLQLAVGVGVWSAGIGVGVLPWQAANVAVTVVWVAGITNAFNLLDNMDGLAGGVAAIAAIAFFVIAAVNGQFLVAALAIAVAGCALGFLRHNFHPATIYMGDAGSLFLGFMLAVVGILLTFQASSGATFLVPVLVLGVAIFDTTLVTATRLRHGRSPLRGGRDHISHRLVTVGIPVPAAVALIYLAAASLGWLALVMARSDLTTGLVMAAWLAAFAAVLGFLLTRVPVYDNCRHRHLVLTEVTANDGLAASADQPERGIDEPAEAVRHEQHA
jgi:UDP-GlcNAc:undecaprenyl-phosphate GlcNAc-1-phosphate transferase